MPHSQCFSTNHLFLYISIISFLVLFVTSKPRYGFSLQLIHWDSPESPFYLSNLTSLQRITRLIKSSEIMENYDSVSNSQRLRFELHHDSVRYVVKLNFGTPAIPLYLLVDTGSDLVWVQCEPCTHRYRQVPPIYNSTASHTYLKFPCENPFCKNNSSTFKCLHGECVYKVEYGSGAVTEGFVAADVFQTSNNAQMQIYFGCSKNNRNFRPFENTGKIGGMIGLSMSPVSLLQQFANITHHRFSYCLTPFTEVTANSLLRFGDDISTRGSRFKSTPIVSPPNKYQYYVNLQDISVEGKRLNFPPNTFALKRDGSGGCIIDSGTPVTRIAEAAYGQVLGAFQIHFDNQGLERVHSPQLGFDLCYKNSQKSPKLASMTFHFQEANFEVDRQYMYVINSQYNVFCVALLHKQHQTVLGSTHQANTRFIFDGAARQILFSPENCLHDRLHI